MTKSDKELPPIIHRSDNDDASSTSYTFPNSPSLQNEEDFRYRSTTTTTSPKKFWDSQPIPSSPTTTTITTNSTIIIENENIKLPYLDRYNRLSLVWISYFSVPLFFVILRVINSM